ncbi:MAG TPA: gliding motility lipoprotein GldD [Flavobacteriales bacterium]|nr:gliding motility lipoprotein GldD [Flavobacteriales bacterium]HRE74221.1 gliding motility lipoprotein GldD [Flavobacteriales bacterium]HRE95728.1 gliding motility lipoprotein GldD [Flavobacteriales bacterium]HRJ35698.1 gliding motility lipoprotein GldD [Flavobacteriales bacterium]HRJ38230.1 gliding motility lipoprotein GldD [Flavobacteriales bacterium]
MKYSFLKFLVVIGIAFFSACSEEEPGVPKPRGYMRIDFPEKEYIEFRGDCPYTFDFPSYARIDHIGRDTVTWCNKNIEFVPFRGTMHLTYKRLQGNVARFIEECHNMAYDHSIKATAIERKQFVNDTAQVFGLLYDIQGNAASPLQFYITDSTTHFIRGALYFQAKPNYDSILPVLTYVREDVERFIESLRWK